MRTPFITDIIRSLMDFLYPPSCAACGTTIECEETLCNICVETIDTLSRNYFPPHRILDNVVKICVLMPYDSLCRTLIHALKYRGAQPLGVFLGGLLARKALIHKVIHPEACIVPVPLHPWKLKERGYNQSERLSEGFARFSGLPIHTNLVARTKNTTTQTALNHDARTVNIRDAFRYIGSQSLNGQPVILIDDVMTTGSTLSECTKAIREGGAGDIVVCVVATPDIGME